MQPPESKPPQQAGRPADPYPALGGWAQAQDATATSVSAQHDSSQYPPTSQYPSIPQPYPGSPYPAPHYGPAPYAQGPYGVAPVPPGTPPQRQPRGLSPYGMPARHPWEIPLLVVVCLITALAMLIAVAACIDLVLDGKQPNIYLIILVFAPIVVWFLRGMSYASMRVNGVKMSPTQFPEGYQLVVEAAARFGMAKVPDAYVVLGNGQINAFASGHGFRRYVAVYSDLFEIGGAAREPEALAFIIGHEVGHIAAGHTSYWRQLGMFVAPSLPIIGSSLIRSQEYTADNHGYCNRHVGAPGAMGTLAAGKYLNKLVGFDEMADRAAVEKGFFVWISNAMSSHPVLTWRMWALRDRGRHGKLFWRPSRPASAPPAGPYPSSYGEVPALPPKTVP
ncbi:M48 family metalloprotease [Nocardia sp. CA-084685]|uniref:M48 family metallopeptidase n=1 Tax=Nocardia sp. CA-084685 TaxID=3239970 RepID=UPI003D9984E3